MLVRSIIEFMQSRGGFERYAIFLILLFLLLLLFFLPLTLSDRCCVIVAQLPLYRAHAGAVNDLSQRYGNRLKMPIQRNVLLDSTGLQSAMFLAEINSLVFSISFAIFSRSHTSVMFISSEVLTMTDHVMVSRTR